MPEMATGHAHGRLFEPRRRTSGPHQSTPVVVIEVQSRLIAVCIYNCVLLQQRKWEECGDRGKQDSGCMSKQVSKDMHGVAVISGRIHRGT